MWEQCVRERVEIFPFCTHVNDSISVKARRGKKGALERVTWPDNGLAVVFFPFLWGWGEMQPQAKTTPCLSSRIHIWKQGRASLIYSKSDHKRVCYKDRKKRW